MLRTERTTIDELEVVVTQWTATHAVEMKLRLMKLLGPSFKDLFTKGSSVKDVFSKGSPDVDHGKVAAVAASFFEGVDPVETTTLLKSILNGVVINGQKMLASTVNQFFGPDDLMTMYKVAVFVVKTNYNLEHFTRGLAVAE